MPHIIDIAWCLSFSFRLTSLSVINSRSIHVLQMSLLHSFLLLLSIIPLYIYVPDLFYPFICWWTLSLTLHILGVVNSAAMNIGVHPWVGLLDHIAALFLIFKGNSILFFIVAAPPYIPTTVEKGSLFSTPSPTLVICRLFNDGYPD